MAKKSKKYLEAAKQIEVGKIYTISEAVALLKKISFVKFNETVGISFNLGVDPTQADQQIRGAMVLPHGTGKEKVVLAITNKVEEAKAAGADFVGTKDMLDKIKNENWFGYDAIVATPDMMGELGKLGKILGPKGLMPNPKTGTVSPDIAKAIKDIKAGKIEYRVDKEGNLHAICGKIKFDQDKLTENIGAICKQIIKIKPSAVKGVYIKNVVLSSTMGPAVKVDPESV
jgi:large subunit ribosomal protein L1